MGEEGPGKDVKVEGEQVECKIFIGKNENQEPEIHLDTELIGSWSDI